MAAPSCSPANHSFYAPFFVPQKNPLTKEPKIDFDFPTQDMYAYYLHMGTLAHLDSPAGGTNPYFHDQISHTTYSDYWQIRNLTPHMHGVKAAVLEVGGLFDAEDLAGPVRLFHSIDKLSPDAPENTLIEGPWVHGRLVTRHRRLSRRHQVRRQPLHLLPRQHRSSLLRALAEEQIVDRAAQGLHLRDRLQRLEEVRRLAAAAGRHEDALPAARWRPRLERAHRAVQQRLLHQRSRAPRAVRPLRHRP